MTSNNGDIFAGWVGTLEFANESRSSDNIKGGYTEEFLWVIDTSTLEDFSSDWNSGVDLINMISCESSFVWKYLQG